MCRMGATTKILLAMALGLILGLILYALPQHYVMDDYLIEGGLDLGGKLFISILKMLVIPIVFVSLVNGTCNLGEQHAFGRLATKTISLYLLTTAMAVCLALAIAAWVNLGFSQPSPLIAEYSAAPTPAIKQVLLNLVPSNPVAALAKGEILQIIIFAILFGMAISYSGQSGAPVRQVFRSLDTVIMKLMQLVLLLAPLGVFCLVAAIFARSGFDLIATLLGYFLTVLSVLSLQLLLVYPLLLALFSQINPQQFYTKLFPAILFAFSTSSSNASIPVVLKIVTERLGIQKHIASFIIPLGATINMDGTAIMQGVATVFIANTYHVDLGVSGYLTVILTATLASIGTAGIPSVGLITLTMVLQQVNLPIDAIGLILGVDRLLDMARTAVNVSGDSAIACIVGKSEGAMDQKRFNAPSPTSKVL